MKSLLSSSFARTLFGGLLFFIVPLIICSIIINSLSAQIASNEVRTSYQNALHVTASQFHDQLQDIDSLVLSMALDDDLNQLSLADEEAFDLYDARQFLKRICLYINYRSLSGNISVYFPKSKWIISTEYGVESASRDYPQYATFFQDVAINSEWAIRPGLRNPDSDYLSLVRGYISDTQSNAIFIIELDIMDALDIVSSMEDSMDVSTFFVADLYGNVYSKNSDMTLLQEKIAEDIYAQAQEQASQDEVMIQLDIEDSIILYNLVPDISLVIGVVINEQALLQPITVLQRYLILLLTISISCSVGFVIIAYQKILKPVQKLLHAMKKIQKGDLATRVQVDRKGDLREIAKQFNQMIHRINVLIEGQYAQKLQLKQAQLRFLNTQIQPHFLYNCLYNLYSMIKSEQLDVAADMTIYLGQYYQINSRASESKVSLSEEINHVRIFWQIHNIRFPGMLSLSVQMDESIKDLEIPNLSLLTLVENTVTHGLKNIDRKTTLTIQCERIQDRACLKIMDQGNAPDSQQLQQIQADLDSVDILNADMHGLQNVLIRLRLMYGDAAVVKVAPNSPHGMIITLSFPIAIKEELDV